MIKKIMAFTLSYLSGAFILCLFSTIQKILAGFPVKISGYIIPFIMGGISGLIIYTLQRHLEEKRKELYHANRLAIMGTLLSKILHEINNPLTVIRLSLDSLKTEVEDGNFSEGDDSAILINSRIDNSMDSLDRIGKIIYLYKNFYKKSLEENKKIDLIELVKLSIEMLKMNKIKECEIKEDYCDRKPFVWGNELQLLQVFINILKNSYDAMENVNNCILSISVKTDQCFAILEIKDNGCGISRNDIKKIWKPFYTTKIGDKGTGLGLPIIKEIITRLKGSVSVSSELKKGTAFIVKLPLIPDGK